MYNLKIRQQNDIQYADNQIHLDSGSVVIAEDLSYVSGICPASYALFDNDVVEVSFDGGESYFNSKIKVDSVRRMGYINYSGSTYWIENGEVKVGEMYYPAYYVKNDDGSKYESAYTNIDGDVVSISDFDDSEWENIKKVVINNNSARTISFTGICGAETYPMVTFGDDTYMIHYSGCSIVHSDIGYTEYSDVPYIVYDSNIVYANVNYVSKDSSSAVTVYVHDGRPSANYYSFSINGTECDCSIFSREVTGNSGNYVYLYVSNNYDLTYASIGDKIFATSSNQTVDKKYVETDDNGLYIEYCGNKSYLSRDLRITALINDSEFDVTFVSEQNSYKIGYLTDYSAITISAEVDSSGYVVTDSSGYVSMYRKVFENKNDDLYMAVEKISGNTYSGVTLEGFNHYAIHETGKTLDSNGDYQSYDNGYYIEIQQGIRSYLDIVDINTAGWIKAIPFAINIDEDDDKYKWYARNVCNDLINDFNSVSFKIMNGIWGIYIPGVGVENVHSEDIYNNLILIPSKRYLNIDIPMSFATDSNQNSEFRNKLIGGTYLDDSINEEVDIERDIYIPTYYTSLSTNVDKEDVPSRLFMVNKINFNIHFRTRDMTNWTVIEDNDNTPTKTMSSWNCLDYYFNKYTYDSQKKTISTSNSDRQKYANDIARHSDLLYYLNFSDNDVFYKKKKISQSFLRLSFYDSMDSNTQSLLWTSTIFLDENKIYSNYIKNVNNFVTDDSSTRENGFVSFASPVYDIPDKSEWLYNINVGSEYVSTGGIVFDESKRLSSVLSVDNKNGTDKSSEGFYIYIFKNLSSSYHPQNIYMKADFNHAGTGKIIPMVSLKKINAADVETNMQAETASDIYHYIDGFPISDFMNYRYIPLSIVYDDTFKKYCYYFKNQNVDNVSDEIDINLFEPKFKK